MKPTILLADDDASLRFVLSQALAKEGYAVQATNNVTTLCKWVQDGRGDLIVSDVYMGETNLFEALPKIRRLRRELPIIVMSAQSTVATALSAAHAGVYDYLPKPFDLEDLFGLIRSALAAGHGEGARTKSIRAQRDEGLPLVGRSLAMQEVFRTIARTAALSLPVLIVGEAGTGKQMVARTIHDHGKRAGDAFRVIHLAGANAKVLDQAFDELANAAGGSVFLDDVDELSADAQRRLANWLQNENQAPDFPRLITATRRDLTKASQEGSFLPDLLYRIGVVTIRVPPLRDRREDLDDLSRALLARAKRDGLPERALDDTALHALAHYEFPGNVRELDNVLRRATALSAGPTISAKDLRADMRESDVAEDLELGVAVALNRWLKNELSGSGPVTQLHEKTVVIVERPLIEHVLEACRGNQIKAASLLGINRNTLRKKMQLLGLAAGRTN
jgi:two-component system nitrogen regulation response regulator GlnG